jgi:hypothetical protein
VRLYFWLLMLTREARWVLRDVRDLRAEIRAAVERIERNA